MIQSWGTLDTKLGFFCKRSSRPLSPSGRSISGALIKQIGEKTMSDNRDNPTGVDHKIIQ